jgi:hypothetical protein
MLSSIAPSSTEKMRVDYASGVIHGKIVMAGGFAYAAGTFDSTHVYTFTGP